MEPLHHDDQRALGGIVEARHQRAFAPVIDGVAGRFGCRLSRLQRVVDDDDVRAFAGRRPLDRRREPIPFRAHSHFRERRAIRRYEGVRDQGPVGVGPQQISKPVRKIARQLFAVGRANDLARRVATKNPGGKGDRGEQALAVSRRDRDQEATNLPVRDPLERPSQDPEVQRAREGRLGRKRGKHQPI
jgi:hypothetical protein